MGKAKTPTHDEVKSPVLPENNDEQNESTSTDPVASNTEDANNNESLTGELKTVDQVFQHAKNTLGSDTTPVEPDADKVIDPEEPVKVIKFDKEAIAEIIKNNDLKTMDKLEKIAKLLPQPANKLMQGLRGLFDQKLN